MPNDDAGYPGFLFRSVAVRGTRDDPGVRGCAILGSLKPGSATTFRGRVLAPDATERRLTLIDDALLQLDDSGRFSSVGPAPPDCAVEETWPGAVILPGFVDAHVHYPQTRVLGSASGPLLPWLQSTVFPEEARFAEADYALAVAEEFCEALIAQGTTLAAIYSSSHPSATDTLLATLDRRGLRGVTGVTLMDRGAPQNVLREAQEALTANAELHERWHERDGRLQLSIVPRFAISCSAALMRSAAEQARERALLVQTHISENLDEITATAALFPDSRDYLAVYEDHGLASPRLVLAHCVHLTDDEWQRVANNDVAVAHCPDSNFFLGSGSMPLRRALDLGIRVGLGSDVGAGRTFSMRRVAAAAYDASLVVGEIVGPEELLWLATRGGAQALGQSETLGCLAPGFDADLAVVDVAGGLGKSALLDALTFRHDAGPVRATLVRGQVLKTLAGNVR